MKPTRKSPHACRVEGCRGLETHPIGAEYTQRERRACEGCSFERWILVNHWRSPGKQATEAHYSKLCGACFALMRAIDLESAAREFRKKAARLFAARKARAAK